MSVGVGGGVCGSKIMGLDEDKESAEKSAPVVHEAGDGKVTSNYTIEDEEEEEEDEDEDEPAIELGPQVTLKAQFEKDKDDESLTRWKEQLLGSVDINKVGESLEADVKILSLTIKSPGIEDIVLPIPQDGKPKGSWFTLKEGSRYRLTFSFQVRNNIVSGLRYTNLVWKTAVKVDSAKEMLGTFSPQDESYTHEMPEETTPSGFFARGSYTAKSKFVDDDNKCYLEIDYSFDIKKEWAGR